jgi:hypothetical protein
VVLEQVSGGNPGLLSGCHSNAPEEIPMTSSGKSGGRGGRTGRGGKGARGAPRGSGNIFGRPGPDAGVGRGAPAAGGPGEPHDDAADASCVCPKCGHKERPVPGRACNKRKCPRCRTLMKQDEKANQ